MTKEEYQKLVGRRIKDLRLKKGISQRQLAFEAKKDPQSLERVENGKSCPTVFYLYEICKALNVDMHDFFNDLGILLIE